MQTCTVRIPEDKKDKLKILASIEKREMKEILSELIDEYIERHKETLELLSKPEWVETIETGKSELTKGERTLKRLNSKMTLVYWKGEKFWTGKILEHPEVMTQGETLEELEENIKETYLLMAMDEVPEKYETKEITI